MRGLKYLFITFLFMSCRSADLYVKNDSERENPIPSEENVELLFSTFLIGDAGAPDLNTQEPVLRLFEKHLRDASDRSAAVFLGDNIYNNGLPSAEDPDRDYYEQRIIEQLKTVENFPGRVIFIPGNHDWNDGKKGGLAAVKRQESFIEDYLDRGNTFLPDNGFPGPVEIELMDDDEHPLLKEDIRLIILDTQWWLHPYEKSFGDNGEYELFDGGDLITHLDDILKKRRNDFLTILGHHPMITLDNHGGYFPAKTHLSPPVFGSLYAFYRRIFGYKQDVTHHSYSELSTTLTGMFKEYEDLVYVSGHSHNLQHHTIVGKRNTQHYIVSGAGSKESYVAKGRGSEFSYAGNGFVILRYYSNGSVWMEAWRPLGDGSDGEMLYQRQLKPPYEDALPAVTASEELPDRDYSRDTVNIAPNASYDDKSKFFRWVAGDHNRAFWSVEAEFPVFDVDSVAGGLTPGRIGGKGQSYSLHMEDEEGNDYVLRSVDKQAGKIWSEDLRKTFALDLAQDQFAILNPYAAIIIPDLADAAGVYHTNPKIYYVPKDPKLGEYAELVGGQLALFEERPNGDMSHVESVGRSEEVISHAELRMEIDGDIDHRVDQEAFARSRLFDLLINDWDRHSDQWRWASFEPEDKVGKIYRPIPRDRDVAMMVMDGVLPSVAKFGPFFQYQNFSDDIGSLRGLGFNSLDLTRRFTNQLTKEQWLQIALDIKNSLTDDVIEKAVRNYPEPVHEQFGSGTESVLKNRRNELVKTAGDYFDFLNKVVTVIGSDKKEKFIITSEVPGEVRVEVYKIKDGEAERKYFDRSILSSQTDEIRIAGLSDDDEFVFRGNRRPDIEMIVIGGPGNDEYYDRSDGAVVSKKARFYDTTRGTELNVSRRAKTNTSTDPLINYIDPESDYKIDRNYVIPDFAYNGDEGLFLGGGYKTVRNRFRRRPASVQMFKANYAPSTGAASVNYEGRFNEIAYGTDFLIQADYRLPKNFRNFFGLGNETTNDDRNIRFYRARLTRFNLEPKIILSREGVFETFLGSSLTITDIRREDDNIVTAPDIGIAENTFEEQMFLNAIAGFTFSDLDNPVNPRQGVELRAENRFHVGVNNTSDTFNRIQGSLEWYISPAIDPQITIANRTGSAHNIGPFPFYEANTVGGTTNLRGFRGNRFSGRTSFYNNTELRLEMLDFYTYLIGGKLGLTGFFDVGRVWTDGEDSDIWHTGYGGGLWFNLFDSIMLNTDIGYSAENYFITAKAGFFF